MENSKLISILRKFTKDEFRNFGRFAASPYFSNGRDCTALYEALKPFRPDFTGNDVTHKSLYERMFPGKDYTASKSYSLLATLSSELYRLAIEFLRYSQLEKEEEQKKLLLLKNLRSKNMNKEFEKEYALDTIENPVTRGSAESFLESSRLNSVLGDYAWDRGYAEKMCYANLNSSADALGFALISAYKYMDTKNSAKYLNIELPESFTDIVLGSLDGEKMLEKMKSEKNNMLPFVSANYYIYMMKQFPDERKYYESLKKTLYSNIDKFGHTEKYMLHQSLETHITIDLEYKGFKEENSRELFELYKNSLELGVYKISPDAYLEPTVFRNIFLTACDVKEFDWAEEFIENYSPELQVEFADETKDHALALVYFNKGEFTAALEKIVNIGYGNSMHKIDAKMLHFRICYELGQIEQAYNLLDTTRHYLWAKDGIAKVYRAKYLNFVKYAGLLLKLKAGKAKDRDFTLDKLMKEEPVKSKSWLVDKMKAIKPGN